MFVVILRNLVHSDHRHLVVYCNKSNASSQETSLKIKTKQNEYFYWEIIYVIFFFKCSNFPEIPAQDTRLPLNSRFHSSVPQILMLEVLALGVYLVYTSSVEWISVIKLSNFHDVRGDKMAVFCHVNGRGSKYLFILFPGESFSVIKHKKTWVILYQCNERVRWQ